MKRKQSYEDIKIKAHAIIWERCAKGMQVKIKSRKNSEDNIKNNRIELLKAVRQHSLNYQEHRYEMSIILDAL
jgi:elongation factor P hydroxylase